MITNFKNFILNERKLNVELLDRDNNWWTNFIKKLNMNEPFPIDDFTNVTITNASEIIAEIVDIDTGKVDKQKAYDFFTTTGKRGGQYKHNIELSNGDSIGLNDLERTWEFGSSAGTSVGTKQTRINESIQAIYFAIRYKKKLPINKDDILEFIEDYKNDNEYALEIYKKVGLNVKITIDDLSPSRGWIDTHITLANMLFDYLDDDIHYVFYQAFSDQKILKVIRNKFYTIIKKMSNIDIDIAKWNPSDIFIVDEDKELRMIKNITESNDDMETFNAIMDYYFEQKYLVGISLKKIDMNHDVRFIINKQEKSSFKYLYSTASNDPTASMSVNINVESESTIKTLKQQVMTARIYTGEKESDMVLEIKGASSKYGKAGMSYLNKLLTDTDISPIPSHFDIELTNEELIQKIEEYYGKLQMGKTNTKTDRYNIRDSRSRLIGKYQSLMLVDILESNKNKPFKNGIIGRLMFMFNKISKTDYIIKQLFYYAYAMGNEIFENCKYFRISNSRDL